MSEYDQAVAALYRAPLSAFVAERKRLSAELKAAGDKDAAARFGKLARPPVSAWVVNQLWWREQSEVEALLSAAARVKAGEREASQAHRQALNHLRDMAADLLRESGNAASEATLRRVTTTLSAVAASGGFAPDAPGALSADRDPPGFETLGFGGAATAAVGARRDDVAPTKAEQTERRHAHEAEAEKRAAEAEKRAAEAEKRRAEEAERQRRLAERERLSALLREASALRDSRQRELRRLRAEVDVAEQSLKEAQALLAELEQELANL